MEQQADQLVQQQSRRKAAANAGNARIQRLIDEHSRNVPLPHAEDVIEPQLLFSLLHEKAVDIEHKDGGKQERDQHADGHEKLHIHIAGGPSRRDVLHAGVVDQGGHDVDSRHVSQQSQEVGEIEFPVAADALEGELGIEGGVTHLPHLPRPGG